VDSFASLQATPGASLINNPLAPRLTALATGSFCSLGYQQEVVAR